MLPGMNNAQQPAPSSNKAAQQNPDAKILDRIDTFELQFALAWKWLLRVAIVVIIVVLIISGVIALSRANALSDAREIYAVGANEQLKGADRITAMKDIVAQYPRAEAAAQLRFSLAKAYLDDGKYDDAIAVYNEITELPGVSNFTVQRAALNVANVHEIAGNIDNALAAYQKVAESLKDASANELLESVVYVEAAYALARMQNDKGLKEAALETLKTMMQKPVFAQLNYSSVAYADLIIRLRMKLDNEVAAIAPKELPKNVGADFSKIPGGGKTMTADEVQKLISDAEAKTKKASEDNAKPAEKPAEQAAPAQPETK